ncbi:MAG: hypothetical protein GY786_24225 [Proteobacteria bacterium]|nr:hypothetical protein [Pseudomonadota bacterium]
MTVAYQFDKKIISLLIFLFIFSLAMAYVAGLVTGVSMERPGDKIASRVIIEKEVPQDKPEAGVSVEKVDTSGLVNQTENTPSSPEFKESSPASEKPELSAPK